MPDSVDGDWQRHRQEACFLVDVDPSADRIRVAGELDDDTSRMLLETVALVRSVRDDDLTIDLRSLSFVSAAGLNALVEVHIDQRRAGRLLTVLAPAPPVARMFAVGGVAWLLSRPTIPAST